MNDPRDVIETPDGFRFDGEAPARLSEVAPLLGVSPRIAAGMAVRNRLRDLRRTDLQSGADA